MNTSYPTNLNDSQWSTILSVLNDKRKRKHSPSLGLIDSQSVKTTRRVEC
jgi:hypothetical protein